jgi:hypothetical protein
MGKPIVRFLSIRFHCSEAGDVEIGEADAMYGWSPGEQTSDYWSARWLNFNFKCKCGKWHEVELFSD